MTGTFEGWIPEHYFDETVPGCRATPGAWLVQCDGVLMINPCDADGDPIFAEGLGPEVVVGEGDHVGFFGLTRFAPVRLRWNGPGPGDYEALTPVAPEATSFWIKGDMDTFATTLADFMDQNCAELEVGETVEIDCHDWSQTTFVLRGGVFVEAAAETAETLQ